MLEPIPPRQKRLVGGWRNPAPRFVTAEPLNVAPSLIGLPLATPARRGAAMLVDLAVVGLLATASGYWLALALLLLAWVLRAALLQEGARRTLALMLSTVVLLAALYTAWDQWRQASPSAAPAATRALVTDAAEPVDLPASASAAERIERLESELERARQALERRSLREQLEGAFEDIGLSFGWGIVYFSLLPTGWRGQTVGKRLFKLRVVELTGKPMTPLRALKRYGGYAAGMATGGLGFVQMLWEPNRQALHDKAAHTVVLDERQLVRGPAPPP